MKKMMDPPNDKFPTSLLPNKLKNMWNIYLNKMNKTKGLKRRSKDFSQIYLDAVLQEMIFQFVQAEFKTNIEIIKFIFVNIIRYFII